jgi:Domain of unknown function (DUF3597)
LFTYGNTLDNHYRGAADHKFQ